MTQGIEGLAGAVAKPPERVPIRIRERDATFSAWRLEVTCQAGNGAIILVEPSPNEAYYRGEGAFLGWPQSKLAEVYRSLLPKESSGPPVELLQLG